MKKFEFIILTLILALGFLTRLYHFTYPVLDWHSWRQSDTSSVSRNFVKYGFDFLHPRFDDLSNVQSGIYDNPKGYRFVEFPIYNALQAGGFILFGNFTIEQWGRLVSIFSSLIAILFLFLILRKYANTTVALLSAFFYAFLPFSIFWGRTILPDQMAIMVTLGGIYFFDLYLENLNKKRFKIISFFVLSIVFFATALLLKPFAVFFFLPAVWLAFEKFKSQMFKRKDLWSIAVLSIFPFILWRLWMLQYPEGIPQSGWLFNGSEIRFKGAFFHWIFAKRIGELILGFWGVALLIVGLLIKRKNKFFISFLVASIIYLFTVATGNVQHSYYQILIMPSIAIFLGLGSSFLITPPKQYISRIVSIPVFIICVTFMFAFSWFEVRNYYNIQDPAIIAAGLAVDRLTPKTAKIVAPYEGDTTFLYQTKRKGWPSFSHPLEELIKGGADFLVLVNPKENDFDIGKKYKIVSFSSQYIIFDLRKTP